MGSGPDDARARAAMAELFQGRFRIHERLPWNGLALVFRAESDVRAVALAVLPLDCESDEALGRRFQIKAAALEALEDPHLVPVLGSGVEQGVPFVEMPPLDVRPLAEELEQEGAIARERALGIARHVLQGLSTAHARGLVHWDLTPSNVLLPPLRSVLNARVVGLGFAQIIRESARLDTTGPTGRGSGPQAIRYLAPELVSSASCDERADVYSVGALLVHMLTGEVPPRHGTPPPSVGRPDLDALIARAMDVDPTDRFENAAEMLAELEATPTFRRIGRDSSIQVEIDDAPEPSVPAPLPTAPAPYEPEMDFPEHAPTVLGAPSFDMMQAQAEAAARDHGAEDDETTVHPKARVATDVDDARRARMQAALNDALATQEPRASKSSRPPPQAGGWPFEDSSRGVAIRRYDQAPRRRASWAVFAIILVAVAVAAAWLGLRSS